MILIFVSFFSCLDDFNLVDTLGRRENWNLSFSRHSLFKPSHQHDSKLPFIYNCFAGVNVHNIFMFNSSLNLVFFNSWLCKMTCNYISSAWRIHNRCSKIKTWSPSDPSQSLRQIVFQKFPFSLPHTVTHTHKHTVWARTVVARNKKICPAHPYNGQ